MSVFIIVIFLVKLYNLNIVIYTKNNILFKMVTNKNKKVFVLKLHKQLFSFKNEFTYIDTIVLLVLLLIKKFSQL